MPLQLQHPEESTLHPLIVLHPNVVMLIFVETLTGKTITLDLKPNDTIDSIQEINGTPPAPTKINNNLKPLSVH